MLSSRKINRREIFNISILVEFIFFTLIFFIAFLISSLFDFTNFYYLALGILIIPVFLSFDFMLKPYFYDFFDRCSVRDIEREKQIEVLFQKKIKVYLLKKNITNIYATGFYGSSKSILIGEELVHRISQNHLLNLIAHELGHLEKNHLFRTYIANFVAIGLYMISAYWMHPYFSSFDAFLEGAFVFLHGMFLGLLLVFIPGLVQKKFELEADVFAALLVGKEEYIATLNALNEITHGVMEKNAINYPSLQKRIYNVKNT
jgi:Zn-dependent protease with chaperone function